MTAPRFVRPVLLGVMSLATALGTGVAVPTGAAVMPARAGTAASADPSGVTVSFERLAGGLTQPVLVTAANDGHSRLFVVERSGRIRMWTSSGLRSGAYLDIRARVRSSGGEQGMLGLAFSPTFSSDRRFWVAYTDSTGGLQISRFRASSAGATTVSASTEVKLFRVAHPTYTNHNAGMLVFGVGKLLFISTGDGGGTGDPFAHAQDPHSLSGKILRIDPFNGCGSRHFCVPASNPYAGTSKGNGMVWHLGLRNPWRFSVDRSTHDLWIADVGQGRIEEVTHVPYSQRGWNLGWSCREGRTVYNASRCKASATYHDPTTVYSHTYGAAVIGGYVYRGSSHAAVLSGLYVFGDFTSGHVWAYGNGTKARVGELGANRLSAFGEGDSGELYVTTLDGGLYRLRASAA